jgi:hypothetical protein
MKSPAGFLAILFLLTAGPLSSQQSQPREDGNNLLEQCTALVNLVDSPSPQNAPLTEYAKSSWCKGYLQATIDRFELTKINLALLATLGLKIAGPENRHEWYLQRLDPVCIPDDAPLIQIARVVVKFLRDHPEKLNAPEGNLVADALEDAFACHHDVSTAPPAKQPPK